MTITREAVAKRLDELKRDEQMLTDRLNSCMGNIQDCQHWLTVLDAPDPSDPS